MVNFLRKVGSFSQRQLMSLFPAPPRGGGSLGAISAKKVMHCRLLLLCISFLAENVWGFHCFFVFYDFFGSGLLKSPVGLLAMGSMWQIPDWPHAHTFFFFVFFKFFWLRPFKIPCGLVSHGVNVANTRLAPRPHLFFLSF